jgi:hypothetical protein
MEAAGRRSRAVNSITVERVIEPGLNQGLKLSIKELHSISLVRLLNEEVAVKQAWSQSDSTSMDFI